MKFIILVVLILSNFANARTLRSGISHKDFPPFYYFDETSKSYKGISVEICVNIALRLGIKIEFSRMPFARVLDSLTMGRTDISCTLYNTGTRAAGYVFTSTPHAFEEEVLFGLTSNSIKLDPTNIKDIKGFDIGGIRGYYYGEVLKNDSKFKMLLARDEVQLLKMLKAKRIDFAVGNVAAIKLHADELEMVDKIKFYQPPIFVGPIYIAFSRKLKDANELVSKFTKELIKFSKTNKYKEIFLRHETKLPQF